MIHKIPQSFIKDYRAFKVNAPNLTLDEYTKTLGAYYRNTQAFKGKPIDDLLTEDELLAYNSLTQILHT